MSELKRLDLGCGPNKRGPEWIGVDCRPFDGKVDVVLDLSEKHSYDVPDGNGGILHRVGDWKAWPWEDNSVDEACSSHFVEHLTANERIHFVNELYRVLKPKGQCQIIVPHWASCRAYGDLTHQWPPVSEFWFYYLSKEWRAANAPHNDGYTCDFDATWGYSFHPMLMVRNQEFQQFAMQFYKEACQDIICTLTKK